MLFVVARTPAALYRQLREQGRGVEEQELVRRAHDLDIALYSARFEPDGTPFQAHGVGTASVMSQLCAPAFVVAAAVVHNAFDHGDWGDARPSGAYESRRKRVRDTLGEDAEELLVAFWRRPSTSTDEILADPQNHIVDRWQKLLDLADLLDKWDDGRVMYSAEGRGDRAYVAKHETEIIDAARRLGSDEFAASLEAAFARVAAETIPQSLLSSRTYSAVIPPASYRKRPALEAAATTYRFLRRARAAARARVHR